MGVEADDILDKYHLTDCALQEGILINFEKKMQGQPLRKAMINAGPWNVTSFENYLPHVQVQWI